MWTLDGNNKLSNQGYKTCQLKRQWNIPETGREGMIEELAGESKFSSIFVMLI